MDSFKHGARRWAVPAALAGTLIAGLLISPVIAGQNGVSSKKVNKTIQKKTNATQIDVAGFKNLSVNTQTIASLNLGPGSYVISSTFDARRDAAAVTISCSLRLLGVSEDGYSSFNGGGVTSFEDGAAMQVAGRAATSTQAQLQCGASGGAASIKNVEIIALKVPKVKLVGG